ncbi:hypothetical protein QBC42DRAFT_311246 [Cladorrhinum samala]|uniref:Uncharacterized protein n=1 Tax=Cladorrhinum samala TaxID=585594 RepID=A0AAV9HHN1_9PEZI|nr:hypothetical protein QBC42DRAFT_311246 [Cladorrhinum samala]
MHIGKLSAIVAQVTLTSASVLAGEEMERRDDWQEAKAAALQKAAAAESQGRLAGAQWQQAAHDAEAQAGEIAAHFERRDDWKDAKAAALKKAAEWEAKAQEISSQNQRRDGWQDIKAAGLQQAAEAEDEARKIAAQFQERNAAAEAPESMVTAAPVLKNRQFPFGNNNGGGRGGFGGFGGFGGGRGGFGGNNNGGGRSGFGGFGGGHGGVGGNNNDGGRGGFGGFGGSRAGLERGRKLGLAAAERAKADWQKRFGGGNGAHRGGGFGGFGGFGRGGKAKRDVEEEKFEARDNSYPTAPVDANGQYFDNGGEHGNQYPSNGQPYAPADYNHGLSPYGGGAAANWQDDVASAQSVAASYQNYGSSIGESYAAYGASVAASYRSEYDPEPTPGPGAPGWQQDVASAHSLASSYRSEYGAPAPETTRQEYSPASTGGLPPPKGTSLVQVNGVATDRTHSFSIAAAMGAVFAAAAVAFGRL